jgi:hypothetical protein
VADFFYGVMQPVSAVTDIRSPAQVGEAMRHIKALGSNITLQLFQQELTAEDWQIYLDVAQQEGMLVIGRLGPPDWNPDPADLSPILDVLALVAEHPALYGFVYLHEPWEVMDTSQMQDIYHEIKGHYPTLRLGVIWSGEIEKSIRRLDPLRQYTADLCDICIINLKAFQNDPQSAEDQGLNRLKVSAEVIQAITPEVELWSSVQVWAPLDGGRRGFRVPQPDEMATLFCAIKAAYPLRGFMWASWALDMPEAPTLDSSELMAQRQAVGDIYNSCVRQS